LYLFLFVLLGVQQKLASKGDFYEILKKLSFKGDTLNVFTTILSVIAILAGVILILELFQVQVPVLDTLVLIIGILWAVIIVVELVGWFTDGFKEFYKSLVVFSVHIMIFSSLLHASKKFD
jgi:hypothetical protein